MPHTERQFDRALEVARAKLRIAHRVSELVQKNLDLDRTLEAITGALPFDDPEPVHVDVVPRHPVEVGGVPAHGVTCRNGSMAGRGPPYAP